MSIVSPPSLLSRSSSSQHFESLKEKFSSNNTTNNINTNNAQTSVPTPISKPATPKRMGSSKSMIIKLNTVGGSNISSPNLLRRSPRAIEFPLSSTSPRSAIASLESGDSLSELVHVLQYCIATPKVLAASPTNRVKIFQYILKKLDSNKPTHPIKSPSIGNGSSSGGVRRKKSTIGGTPPSLSSSGTFSSSSSLLMPSSSEYIWSFTGLEGLAAIVEGASSATASLSPFYLCIVKSEKDAEDDSFFPSSSISSTSSTSNSMDSNPSSASSSFSPSFLTLSNSNSFSSPLNSPRSSSSSTIQGFPTSKMSVQAAWRVEYTSSFYRVSTPDTRYHASIFQSKTAGLFALVFDNYEQGEHFYNSVSNAFGSAGRAMDVLSALHSPISFDYGIPYPPFSEHEEGLICTLNAWIATKEEEKKDNLQTLREEERSWNTFLTKINTLRETLQSSSSSSSTLPGEDIDSLLSSIEESARFYNGFFRSNLIDFKEDENDGSETERRKKKKKQKEEGKLKVESSSSSSSVTSSSSFLNSKKVIENTLPISRSHSMNYEEEKRKSKHKGSSSAKKKDKGSSTSSKQRKSKKDELYSDSHSVIVTRDRREGSPRGSRKGQHSGSMSTSEKHSSMPGCNEELAQILKNLPSMEMTPSKIRSTRGSSVINKPQTPSLALQQLQNEMSLPQKRKSTEKRLSLGTLRDKLVQAMDDPIRIQRNLEDHYSVSLPKDVIAGFKKVGMDSGKSSDMASHVWSKKDPILFDPDTLLPIAAEIGTLVDYVVIENTDIDLLMSFLLGYRAFTSPNEFFDGLVQLYHKSFSTSPEPLTNSGSEIKTEEHLSPSQTRVIFVFHRWLQYYFRVDFAGRPELQKRLLSFCQVDLERSTFGSAHRLSTFLLDPLISSGVMVPELLHYATTTSAATGSNKTGLTPRKSIAALLKVKKKGSDDVVIEIKEPPKEKEKFLGGKDKYKAKEKELQREKEKEKEKEKEREREKEEKERAKHRLSAAPASNRQKSNSNIRSLFHKATGTGGGGSYLSDIPVTKSSSLPSVKDLGEGSPSVFASVSFANVASALNEKDSDEGVGGYREGRKILIPQQPSTSAPLSETPPDHTPPVVRWSSSTVDLLEVPANVIAASLTLLEHQLFKKTNATMCLDPTLISSSAPVQTIVNHFNHVSNWVAHEIVMTPNIKTRTSLLKHFISVADHCRQLNNFNSLLEIMAGLNMAPVQRLKKTWQIGKAKKVFTALEELMDTKNNYRQYRQEVAEAALHLPCLPYFGIYLRDFTFIDVGNPAYLTKKMVNVNRLLLMWNVAKEMDRCQSVDFHFEEEITSFSQNLKTAIQTIGTQSTDDRLYHFSHLCEPNTGTGDGIVASASATSLSLINTTVVVSSSSPDTSPFSSSH